MSYHHKGPGPIPNRWLYCPRSADSLVSERFLPFKTPLSTKFNSSMPLECQFEPNMVFEIAKSILNVKIGLWIDLTNTSRFYDRKEIEAKGCQYFKLNCRGHGETPSPEQTQAFFEIVDNFIMDHPLEKVAIHCTHGFNRTGFLIVSYLVERMDCSVEAALQTFSYARPPGIYKGDYIRELFRRYEDEDDALPPPDMPNWCFEYDDRDHAEYDDTNGDDNSGKRKHKADDDDQQHGSHESDADVSIAHGSSGGGDDGDGGEFSSSAGGSTSTTTSTTDQPQRKKKRRERFNPNATFMAGVPGVKLYSEQPGLGELQQLVQTMCGWEGNGFPGCQPVSMDMSNILLLSQKSYRVSWKADGTRYMMLILKENEIYFFDRDHSCFKVSDLKFPQRKDLSKHLKDTLLDGEMVIDKVNGQSIPRYLVYDIIVIDGKHVGKQSFSKVRLKCIQAEITEPRHEAMRRGLIVRNQEPFSVRLKNFYEVTQARALLSPKFAKNLSHEPDGLIFQPSMTPYIAGACDEVLKWKPLDMNSVDFRLKIEKEEGMGIITRKIGKLFVGQHDAPFAIIKYTKALRELDNKIIECKFENNCWVFMRERSDKSYPNSYNTAMAVCNSIRYPVTTDILLDYIDNQRFIEDSEIMPPPPVPNR